MVEKEVTGCGGVGIRGGMGVTGGGGGGVGGGGLGGGGEEEGSYHGETRREVEGEKLAFVEKFVGRAEGGGGFSG